MPYYEMKLDFGAKIKQLCLATIGKEPSIISTTSSGRRFKIEFDEDLTTQEEQDLLNALPPMIRLLYTFEKKTGTMEPQFT